MAADVEDRSQALDALKRQLGAITTIDDETAHRSTHALMPGSTSLVLSQLPAASVWPRRPRGSPMPTTCSTAGRSSLRRTTAASPSPRLEPEDVLVAMETTLLSLHALMVLVAPHQAARGLTGIALLRARGPAA